MTPAVPSFGLWAKKTLDDAIPIKSNKKKTNSDKEEKSLGDSK